jgi:hypothetical protein
MLRPDQSLGSLVSFAPCVYATDKKKALAASILSPLISKISNLWERVGDRAWIRERFIEIQASMDAEEILGSTGRTVLESYLNQELHEYYFWAAADMLRLAALCKHSSFFEEEEWRLALPTSPERPLMKVDRLFRLRNGTEVPYIAFDLTDSFTGRMPLTAIVIGPGNSSGVKDSVLHLLESNGYAVPVRESLIPFRP